MWYNQAMQKRIFMDNAATSFPKAPGIADVMRDFLERDCTNINRTNSKTEFGIFERLYSLRSMISDLLHLGSAESVILGSGVTLALNMLIKGLFTCDDHILVSSCEHNSVMRPLVQSGIPFSRIPSDSEGYILIDGMADLLRPNTKAMVICAAGNVTGAVQSLASLSQFAHEHNLMLFLDAAQAVPYVDIDMKALGIDGVAFSGHKGLLGPEGTGGLALRKELAQSLPPLVSGGTGSQSDSEDVPQTLPDRLEAGTQNIPGLLGLEHSVRYVKQNHAKLKDNERRMTELLYCGLQSLDGIKIVGAPLHRMRTSVISVTSDRMDIAQISATLLERYSIDTRVGLHCSPSSHKSIGTFPTGTLRFSPGPFTTEEDVESTLSAMKETLGDFHD